MEITSINSNLIDCLNPYNTIGVVGMCKNAGKTTVVNYIIDEYKENYVLGITSIGYDGEERDEITKLKKPRIEMSPDMIVATCESCLKKADAKYRVLTNTGIRTALGEVIIIKIKTKGLVEVAGPSMVSQIEALCIEMKKLGAEKVIVDGAAGRISFASRLECTVLSVGAAMSNDMNKVVRQASHQIELFDLKPCDMSYAIKFTGNRPYAVLKQDEEVQVVFWGAMVGDDLLDVMTRYKGYKIKAVVNDAASVFVLPRTLKKFRHKGGEILVQNGTNVVAVTINPMSPYGKWYDKDEFLKKMQGSVDLPVFNVMEK